MVLKPAGRRMFACRLESSVSTLETFLHPTLETMRSPYCVSVSSLVPSASGFVKKF